MSWVCVWWWWLSEWLKVLIREEKWLQWKLLTLYWILSLRYKRLVNINNNHHDKVSTMKIILCHQPYPTGGIMATKILMKLKMISDADVAYYYYYRCYYKNLKLIIIMMMMMNLCIRWCWWKKSSISYSESIDWKIQ